MSKDIEVDRNGIVVRIVYRHMDVPAPVYILLLVLIIVGPVLANVAYNGWKRVLLSRIFLVISAIAMVSLMIIVLLEL